MLISDAIVLSQAFGRVVCYRQGFNGRSDVWDNGSFEDSCIYQISQNGEKKHISIISLGHDRFAHVKLNIDFTSGVLSISVEQTCRSRYKQSDL